jgi:hypothetical protein
MYPPQGLGGPTSTSGAVVESLTHLTYLDLARNMYTVCCFLVYGYSKKKESRELFALLRDIFDGSFDPE